MVAETRARSSPALAERRSALEPPILSIMLGLAVNGRDFASLKTTNENSVLKEPPCEDSWLGHSEAAAYLGISKSTLYHYSCHDQIERRKLGGRLEYRSPALDKFKEDHTQPANCRSSSTHINCVGSLLWQVERAPNGPVSKKGFEVLVDELYGVQGTLVCVNQDFQ